MLCFNPRIFWGPHIIETPSTLALISVVCTLELVPDPLIHGSRTTRSAIRPHSFYPPTPKPRATTLRWVLSVDWSQGWARGDAFPNPGRLRSLSVYWLEWPVRVSKRVRPAAGHGKSLGNEPRFPRALIRGPPCSRPAPALPLPSDSASGSASEKRSLRSV